MSHFGVVGVGEGQGGWHGFFRFVFFVSFLLFIGDVLFKRFSD